MLEILKARAKLQDGARLMAGYVIQEVVLWRVYIVALPPQVTSADHTKIELPEEMGKRQRDLGDGKGLPDAAARPNTEREVWLRGALSLPALGLVHFPRVEPTFRHVTAGILPVCCTAVHGVDGSGDLAAAWKKLTVNSGSSPLHLAPKGAATGRCDAQRLVKTGSKEDARVQLGSETYLVCRAECRPYFLRRAPVAAWRPR